MYFKGFHKMRDQWNEDAWETRCSEIFGQAIDECFEDALEMTEHFPRKYRKSIMDGIGEDLRELDKTLRFLKSEGFHADDIDYVLLETADYYSDRHINKYSYNDEPVKDHASRYPTSSRGGARYGKRARARQDAWATFTLIIDF